MVHRQQLDRLISTNLPAISLWGLVVFVSIATAKRCYCGRQFAEANSIGPSRWRMCPGRRARARRLFSALCYCLGGSSRKFRGRNHTVCVYLIVHVGKGSSSKKQGDDTPCKVQAYDTGRTGWYGRSHLAHA